jgi:phosphatidylserine decarboxylase
MATAPDESELRPVGWLLDELAVGAQYVLPKLALTKLMGRLAEVEGGAFTTTVIRWFIRHYGVNMLEAVPQNPAAYRTFNEFFTRRLASGARALTKGTDLVCPVDGAISQFGAIEGDQIFQAKGHHYSTTALLGGDTALAQQFQGGHFATLYLSPKDYHRIHMPCAGHLRGMKHVPGALFSVNPVTARGVPGLFARNERVVCVFEGDCGPWVLVLVGATIVGSMSTTWHGVVNGLRPSRVREWTYEGQDVKLAQGDEMGRFLLGSTVVLLFPQKRLAWNTGWAPGVGVRMGERMADWV